MMHQPAHIWSWNAYMFYVYACIGMERKKESMCDIPDWYSFFSNVWCVERSKASTQYTFVTIPFHVCHFIKIDYYYVRWLYGYVSQTWHSSFHEQCYVCTQRSTRNGESDDASLFLFHCVFACRTAFFSFFLHFMKLSIIVTIQ